MEYKNFFENQKEASMRLTGTVVLFDGEPVEILAVTDHVGDGLLRAFIEPTGYTPEEREAKERPELHSFPPDSNSSGPYLESWIKEHPSTDITMQVLNSPKFNRFRPFELGMVNHPPDVFYVQRQPTRRVEQGLVPPMLFTRKPVANEEKEKHFVKVDLFGKEMRECILGNYPSAERCLEGLTNKNYINNAAAFHREFALMKGAMDTLYLAYKADIVGALPNRDFSVLQLNHKFRYVRELIEDLNLFKEIKV